MAPKGVGVGVGLKHWAKLFIGCSSAKSTSLPRETGDMPPPSEDF